MIAGFRTVLLPPFASPIHAGSVHTTSTAAAAVDGFPPTLLADYARLYPKLSEAQIYERLDSLGPRKRLIESLPAIFHSTFSGTWFDFSENILHIAATADSSLQEMLALANSRGVQSVGSISKYSCEELEVARREAEVLAIRAGIEGYELSVDVKENRVRVVLPSRYGEMAQEMALNPRIVASLSDNIAKVYPAACTDRYACGRPLRGGINLGRYNPSTGEAFVGCSIGFTTTATDGSRWVYGAGHCVTPLEVTNHVVYWHGEQAIGDARYTYDQGSVDISRIRIEGSYWPASPGGYMYYTPAAPVDVDYAIIYNSTIDEGDPVCFNGRNYIPSDDNCGVVDSVNNNGKRQVDGVKLCGGDSGGSTYLLLSPTERWAYGILAYSSERTEPGNCTGNGTGFGGFSTLPNINTQMDSVTAANVRVDVR